MIDTKALRQKILDMAIRGLLVPQDPTDEPASTLLEKIRAEKQRLIKEGKIKKDKSDSVIYKGDDNRYYEKIGNNAPKCIGEELPFDIPDSWRWIKLGYIVNVISGVSYDKKDVCAEGIRILRGGNIANFQVTTSNDDIFLPDKYFDKEKQLKENDILIVASTGSKTVIGKAGFINEIFENTQIGAFLRIIRSISNVFVPYLKVIFSSHYYMGYISQKSNGTNINNIKAEYITNFIIPIPPLTEQRRIVEHIEKLFAQIDIIENNQAALEQLYNDLKKKTLDLAIRGKLVTQDPNNEPASELLKRIRSEKKAQLGKKYVDSYIYKGDDNCYYEHIDGKHNDNTIKVPFDLPNNWAWACISEIAILQSGKPFEETREGIPYIKVSDMNILANGTEITTSQHFCKAKDSETIPMNSILFPKRGGAISTNKKRKVRSIKCCIDLNTMCMTPYLNQTLEYIFQWFLTVDLGRMHDGTSVPQINNVDIYPLLIPIPPLSEQRRIVDKINEIFVRL